MSISIVAIFVSKDNMEPKLTSLFKSVIESTRKESGCLNYTLYLDQENPKRFTFLEEWQNKACLEKHLDSDCIQDLFNNIQDLIESSEIIELSKIK